MGKKKKKKNKLRVAFHKNRQKRARAQNVTHDLLDNPESAGDQTMAERISGKGDVSRHRTVIGAESDADGMVRQIDEDACLAGRVLSSIGLLNLVQSDDGHTFECTVRRVVRTLSRDHRSAVVTGDRVRFQPTGHEHEGVIERVEPRRGVLARGNGRRQHIIVANVDQVVIIASAADPQLKPNLIDRFLVSAEKGDVRSIICINKTDLVNPATLQPIAGMYARLGYDVVLTSANNGTGIDHLRHLIRDRETVFSGQSGVGKSSLLNQIEPQLVLNTGDVSHWTRKGRHTTRRAILHPLTMGGWVADTPGIRQFELWDVQPEEVEGFFVEFRPFVTHCRFPDCTHTHESDCGIKQAVARGWISSMRYDSYLRILDNRIA